MATFSGFHISVTFESTLEANIDREHEDGQVEIDPLTLFDTPGSRLIEVRSVQPGGTKLWDKDEADKQLDAYFRPRIIAMIDEYFGREVEWDVRTDFPWKEESDDFTGTR